MLWFQRQHLVAGALRGSESSAREHQTDAAVRRISCVFLCIFLLLQREMRGYALQLWSQLCLAMLRIFPRVGALNPGVAASPVLGSVTVGGCEHRRAMVVAQPVKV